MKINKVILQNFRGYKGYHEISLSNLNLFIGKNDIGKSTILEALDIILDGGVIKFDKDDICKFKGDKEEVILGIEFTNVPSSIIIDSTAETTLNDELLLKKEDQLLYLLKGKNTATLKPYIRTQFPKHTKYKKIFEKTLDELKTLVNELMIDKKTIKFDERNKASLRKAIRNHLSKTPKGLELIQQDVLIEKEDGKSVYEQIKKYFPTYALFQSDRKNEDQDKEAQDPMKTATKEILGSMQSELEKIQNDVKKYVEEVALKTLEKLSEMNPELAENLTPEFSKNPEWSSLFKYSITTKDSIPLNKRGSGVKRLILLNFFRAKAEKNLNDLLNKETKSTNDIVYAFEEPETSQHPDYQKLLVNSFIELSQQQNIQILFTTHSPEVAKMIEPEYIKFISKKDNELLIQQGDDKIFKEIAENLGVLPSLELKNIEQVKIAVCLEGKNDIAFLENINQNIPELKEIIDLSGNSCILLPMGGSSLQYWVNNNYLGKLNLSQVHIYDSDIGSEKPHKYKSYLEEIGERLKSVGFETQKREMENYIHPDLIKGKYGLEIVVDSSWDTADIPLKIVEFNHNKSDSDKTWEEAKKKENKIKEKTGKVKTQLNSELSKELTKDMLEDLGAWDEVKAWFEKIKKLIGN